MAAPEINSSTLLLVFSHPSVTSRTPNLGQRGKPSPQGAVGEVDKVGDGPQPSRRRRHPRRRGQRRGRGSGPGERGDSAAHRCEAKPSTGGGAEQGTAAGGRAGFSCRNQKPFLSGLLHHHGAEQLGGRQDAGRVHLRLPGEAQPHELRQGLHKRGQGRHRPRCD